ncbi:MAG: archaeosortase/exosortase family protein [Bacteroidota bacterium]|nr:archaeosortase/exosortase family protein [Bacteroidota bacterium]
MISLKQNAFFRFIVFAALLYAILFFVYQYVIKKYTYYDQKFIGSIITSSEYFVKLLGYKTFTVLQDRDYQVVGIDGSNGVWVGSNCNAITLFSLFSVFIIAYPGNQKNKLWFIPTGIVLIHLLNLIRVVALVLIAYYSPTSLNFNHTYTFTFLVYAFILFLWIVWVNKFSQKKTKSKDES